MSTIRELSERLGASKSTIHRLKSGGMTDEQIEKRLSHGLSQVDTKAVPKPLSHAVPLSQGVVGTESGTRIESGKCHGCQKSVIEAICICLPCVESGVTHAKLGLNIQDCTPPNAPRQLDRVHAPECPCTTCKGIPPKKESKKKH